MTVDLDFVSAFCAKKLFYFSHEKKSLQTTVQIVFLRMLLYFYLPAQSKRFVQITFVFHLSKLLNQHFVNKEKNGILKELKIQKLLLLSFYHCCLLQCTTLL